MPKRVPIKAAKDLAKSYGLRQVILGAWDGKLTHVVTYGVSKEDCAQAAKGGNIFKDALGWPKDLYAEPSRLAELMDIIEDQRREIESLENLVDDLKIDVRNLDRQLDDRDQ